jgi:hypothetical protein
MSRRSYGKNREPAGGLSACESGGNGVQSRVELSRRDVVRPIQGNRISPSVIAKKSVR